MNEFQKIPKEEFEPNYLDILTKQLDEIAGQWNGDEAGSQEDMSHAASEAIDKIKELKELLIELNIK